MESTTDQETLIEAPFEEIEDCIPMEEGAVRDAEEISGRAQLERLEELVARGFQELGRRFDDRLAYDGTKEQQINRLHEELQEYKRDLLAKTKRPLIQGLIRLHDDLGKTTAALAKRPEEELTAERFFQTFKDLAEDLELLLGQHGVEPFTAPGAVFDPQRQIAMVTEVTEDAAAVGTIAAHLRPGFIQGETILQKERVVVYSAPRSASGVV